MTHLILRKTFFSIVLICPIVIIPLLLHADPVEAADCVSKACIDVYTQDGQIIIEGRKGTGVKVKPAPTLAPKPKPKPKPKLRITLTPRPAPKPAMVKKPLIKATPRARKRAVRKVLPKVTAGVSLNDRLVKLLPMASIARQPAANAIVNVPVIYWCNLPKVFMAKVTIIGEGIDVAMRPSFLWSFGDGSFFATTKTGAAFPQQEISHTYSHAGTYLVTMLATWGGIWIHNGVARAITGEVRKISFATVSVANGPTRLTR